MAELEFQLRSWSANARRREAEEMRILVVGDFSGAEGDQRLVHSGDGWPRLRPVDVDSFDAVMRVVRPQVVYPPGAAGEIVEFDEVEAFHPDSLYARLDLFAQLRDLRSRLADPAQFEAAAAEVRAQMRGAELPDTDIEGARAAPDSRDEGEADSQTFARLLGSSSGGNAPPASTGSGAEQFIRGLVAPYIQSEPNPAQAVYLSGVSEATADLMRGFLHHGPTQALEARWRALRSLVFDEAVGDAVEVAILDVGPAKLRVDLAQAGADLVNSELAQAILGAVDGPDATPWSLLVADWEVGGSVEDARELAALGAIGAAAGAPWVLGANPQCVGCSSSEGLQDPASFGPPSGDAAWEALRASPYSAWLGLVLPRVMSRLPYGANTDAIDAFEFEELEVPPSHDGLLWGSGALAAATLVARSFAASGWADDAPGGGTDLDDLPVYTWVEGGESQMVPCAERFLGERAGEALLERGLMPLLSHRNRGAARLLRLQSLASPPSGLAGPWRR